MVELHRMQEGRDSPTVTVERFPASNHYIAQVEAFCRTVRTGSSFPWSLEDALGTQRMIDAVFEKAGRPAS
jgi:predicted dehydrogenase